MMITAFGESKKLNDWIKDERCHARADTIYRRIHELGWESEKSISKNPVNLKKTNHFKNGDKFGFLILTGNFKSINNKRNAECICVCGKVDYWKTSNLINGYTKSCGCKKGEGTSNGLRKHGLSRSNNGRRHPIYGVWLGMKYRCYSKTDKSYKNYGGRGIKVCDFFLVFENFYNWAIEGWSKGLTLERKRNNENYSPENCEWITISKQQLNKRTCIMIEAFGEKKCVAEWIRDSRCLISASGLKNRIKNNFNAEDAISMPAFCKSK